MAGGWASKSNMMADSSRAVLHRIYIVEKVGVWVDFGWKSYYFMIP